MNVSYKWLLANLFAGLFGTTTANAQGVHGVLRVVKGDVQIKSAKTGAATKARLGAQVFPKDIILTGKDSRAKIVMVDNNELNVSPESQLEIQQYEYDPGAGKKEVLLNVIYGKVRSKVEQKYDGKTSKFQIKTPSAVAGVRGTDFLTSFNAANKTSQITTFEGKVEFGTLGPRGAIMNPVFVGPGAQASSVAGATPTPPAPVPKEELAKMDKDSKSEPAPGKNEGDSRQPAGDKDKGKEKDKEQSKSDDGANKETAKSDDKDKKADNASGDGGKGDLGKGDSAKSDDRKGNSGSSPSSETPRGPASVGPGNATSPPAGGAPPPAAGMFRPEDFAGGGGPALPGDFGPAMPLLPGPGLIPNTPTTGLPVCDFCRDVIRGGNSRVLIHINTQ